MARAAVYLGSGAAFVFGSYALYLMIEGREKKDVPAVRRYTGKKVEEGGGGEYSHQEEMRSVLFGGGPADLKMLRQQTAERRKRLGEEYARAQYEKALKIQEEDRRREEEEAERRRKEQGRDAH